jgi:hypothetical protein
MTKNTKTYKGKITVDKKPLFVKKIQTASKENHVLQLTTDQLLDQHPELASLIASLDATEELSITITSRDVTFCICSAPKTEALQLDLFSCPV